MAKVYVLDTNVLIYDPRAIFRFQNNDVVLPIFVIEEVDKFKREQTDRGRNARAVGKILDDLREKGSLKEGVPLPDGGTLKIRVPLGFPRLPGSLDPGNKDSAILQTALFVKEENKGRETILVTMDTNLRVRSDSYGLATETYRSGSVSVEAVTSSVTEMDVLSKDISTFFRAKSFHIPREEEGGTSTPHENASVLMTAVDCHGQSALARMKKGRLVPLSLPKNILGISPKNMEQSFALDLLLDPDVALVTLLGVAGTGKTLLATCAGLSQVLDGVYERIIITRPVVPLGRDIGFLPGSKEEKLDPWMQPIYDNLAHILKHGKSPMTVDELKEKEIIKMEPITYIRGRSLSGQFIIVDEAQNLSPHEVKTLVTRCGEGTKIILTGDPFQIDNPYVDSTSNGLSVVAHRFKGQPLAGHVALMKGERSPLADLATKLLLLPDGPEISQDLVAVPFDLQRMSSFGRRIGKEDLGGGVRTFQALPEGRGVFHIREAEFKRVTVVLGPERGEGVEGHGTILYGTPLLRSTLTDKITPGVSHGTGSSCRSWARVPNP